MGKPTGFLEYERKESVGEAPLKRIKHFNEFHTPLSKKEQEMLTLVITDIPELGCCIAHMPDEVRIFPADLYGCFL